MDDSKHPAVLAADLAEPWDEIAAAESRDPETWEVLVRGGVLAIGA